MSDVRIAVSGQYAGYNAYVRARRCSRGSRSIVPVCRWLATTILQEGSTWTAAANR